MTKKRKTIEVIEAGYENILITILWYTEIKLVLVGDNTDIAPLVVFESYMQDSIFENQETFKKNIMKDKKEYIDMFVSYKFRCQDS